MTTKPIQIFKGDDTDFNYGNLVAFQFESNLDLSAFTGAFELGEYKQVSALSQNSMTVNIPRNITANFPLGTMYGTFRLMDTLGRVGTVSNTIEFYVTNTPFTPESCTVNLSVPEGYPVTITMQIGFQNGDYEVLNNKPSINGVTLEKGQTGADLNLQDKLTAGDNISIDNNVISAVDEKAIWGNISGTLSNQTDLQNALNGKQATISDLETIRSGAALGATAVQPATLNDYATTTDLSQGLALKQDKLTTDQQSAVDSGIDSTKVGQIATNASNISSIEGKIPAQASSINQLADKAFVNSSVATSTANFIGTFNSVSDLEAYSGTLTNNDYAFVISTDSAGNTIYNRYKYTTATTPESWEFEYALNNSSFTAEQWAAIQSGITSVLVTQIGTNQSNITSLQSNKLDTTTAASTYLTQSAASSTYLTQSAASSTYIPLTQKGAANGVATLDSNTLIPASQIPVDNDTITVENGKIKATGGGSGSAPTFTTFTNKSGSSFDTAISGLDSKTAMVFKNGLLLEKGTAGVATKIYRGGYTYGLTLTNTAPISTANSWEIRTVYTYDGGGRYPTVFGTSGSDFWKTPFMHLEGGEMKVWVSSDGQEAGAFLRGVSLGLYPSLGETYYLKLIYDSVHGYKAFYSTTGFDNGTEVEISSNTMKAFCAVPFMFLNQLTGSQGEYNSNGSINWTATKIIIDGETWFDGATAVENTDYINTGCVETIIPPAISITNDYAVSDSTISFATPLSTTDKITVGVF